MTIRAVLFDVYGTLVRIGERRAPFRALLTRMEAAGMVERRKAEQDQRRVLVRLAPQGQASFDSMSQSMEENYQRLQGKLGEQKLQTLLELLNDLKAIRR